jgi:2,4-dienoyl-CoA reductase-like NADH-dependent reductase (Old Yellow Enzyme family)
LWIIYIYNGLKRKGVEKMEEREKSALFQPFYSEKLTVKNKIVLSAVPTGFVENGVPTHQNIQFYGDRAKSVGLIQY